MEISLTQEQGKVPVVVLKVKGNITSEVELQAKAQEAHDAGSHHILLDLSDVAYMSSAGLRVLQHVFDRLRSLSSDDNNKEMYRQINDGSYASPNLKLINPNKDVMEVLKMSGFDMLISVEKDLKTAVASF